MSDGEKRAESEVPPGTSVFLSYAGDDEWWVRAFRDETWFTLARHAHIQDYRADSVGYGPLKAALDERINRSAVVIAFVSKIYTRKEWTVAEWEQSLTQAQRRKLVFVPVLLDATARDWWKMLRNTGRLSGLTRDYQYEDFTNGGVGFARIVAGDPDTSGKIAKLSRRIMQELHDAERPPPPPLPGPQPSPQSGVVLLGHPTAQLARQLVPQVDALAVAMRVQQVSFRRWESEWLDDPSSRASLDGLSDPIFVQPLTRAEAVQQADVPETTGGHLETAGRPGARVTLWLPRGADVPRFEAAASRTAGGGFPALRTDGPEDLARWLHAQVAPADADGDALVVQIEDVGSPEGVKQQDAAAAQRLAEQLRDVVWRIVSGMIEHPRPSPPAWPFWDTHFAKQLKILPGSRAIVAVHDLDIRPNPNRMAVRKDFQRKFDKMHRDLEAEQSARRQAGLPELRLFWTALLVNNAEALPFATYPDDGRYKDWRLLGFQPANEAAEPGRVVPLRPDPSSLAVFRTNLLAWANAA